MRDVEGDDRKGDEWDARTQRDTRKRDRCPGLSLWDDIRAKVSQEQVCANWDENRGVGGFPIGLWNIKDGQDVRW